MESLHGERRFLRPFVQENRQMAHPALTKDFLQAAAGKQTNGTPSIDQGFSTGSCNRHHALSGRAVDPPFLLAQNVSSKRIAPTDNMPPESDDAKSRHRLLKG